jgi:SPP1 gp7 family putative phage head morphogenesis protein
MMRAVPDPIRIEPVPFDDAILAMRARDVVLPDAYYGHIQGVARADSFSVAGISKAEQLKQVQESLAQALEQGETFEAWKSRVRRGEIPLELPDYRLENIYRTNLQGAYARGRCKQQAVIAERRPWLMYSAINDSRTRPAHAALDGMILRRDDPFFATHRPPNGHNCRCTVIALSESQAMARGAPKAPRPDPTTGQTPQPDPGWEYDVCRDPRGGTKRGMNRVRAHSSPAIAEKLDGVQMIANSEDPSTWRALPSTQRGSTPGGMYAAADGRQHYVKNYDSPDLIHADIAGARIYGQFGAQTLGPRTVEIDGVTGVATAWVDGLTRVNIDDLPARDLGDLANIYTASALTRNLSIADENIMRHPNGRLVVIDTGGAFADPFGADVSDVMDLMRTLPMSAIRGAQYDLIRMTREDIERVLILGGYSMADVERLSAIIEARRLALIAEL